jgi:hypothetical protein
VDQPFSLDSEGAGGSGTIVDQTGLILTNAHVIPEGVEEYEDGCLIILPDEYGQPSEAYVASAYVYGDIGRSYDIAFLEAIKPYIDGEGNVWGSTDKLFPAINDAACSEEEVTLGEEVKIFGYPSATGGINLTVTNGVVSSFDDYGFYTSAKVDEGNSGGAAFDKNDCFLGIPTSFSSGAAESYGYVLDSRTITEFVEQIEDSSLLE